MNAGGEGTIVRASGPVERDETHRESVGSPVRLERWRPLSRKFILVSFLVLNALIWTGLLLAWL